ncbi:UNVERIFIED_CONTAM: hypothetical protein RMT77_005090 [Armadillidium vulgare]
MAGFLDPGKERKTFKKLDRDFGNFDLESMKTPINSFPKSTLPRFKNSQLASSLDDQSNHFHSTNHWDKRSSRRYHGDSEYRGGKSWRHYENSKEAFKGDVGYPLGSEDVPIENSNIVTPVILTREKNANDIKFISNSTASTGSNTSVATTNPTVVTAASNFNQIKECDIPNNEQVPPPVSTPTPSKQYQIAPKPNALEAVIPELEMTSPLKLLDDSLLVGEDFGPYLLDQSNFLVIAVVGLQGAGKSTIASMLADPLTEEKFISTRSWVFRPESRDEVLRGSHSTCGVETFITKDRVIILDLQPLLSPSVMDFVVAQERKTSLDFSSSTENMLEIESLQLLTFAMSVAHVLVVVQDYIFHPNLIRLLHTCQMMKPTQSSSHNSSSGVGNNRDGINRCGTFDTSDIQHFFPHLVFIHNRSFPQHFVPKFIEELQILYHTTLGDSSLCIESQIGMCSGTFSPPVNNISVNLNINLFLIPDFNYQDNCCVSFIESIEEMRRQLFSLSRCPLTHVTLTEKSWYQYACRMWESIRKSSLYVEIQSPFYLDRELI